MSAYNFGGRGSLVDHRNFGTWPAAT